MASYQELLAYFQQNVPGGVAALQTPQGGDVFNKWIGDIMADLGLGTWEEVPVAELDNYEYVGPVTQPSGPAEQVIADAITPGLIKQVEGDVARQAEVDRLGAQTTADFGSLRNTLDLANVTTGPNGQLTSPLLTSQNAAVDAATATEIGAATTSTARQLDALNTSISQMRGALTGAQAEQGAALQAQIATLRGNLGTMTTAQRAALEQQLVELNAAQGPMSAARLAAAEGFVTAVNVGLEQTRDQLTADAAREGFVGGSTMQDSALARSVVDARQAGANTVGQAQLANASDVRDIATYGAGGRYSIADAFATDTRRIGDLDATTGYENAGRGIAGQLDLTNSLAGGRFNLASSLASQEQDAANRNAAARLGYSDAAYGNAINAGQIRTGLGPAEVAAQTALIPYGTAGTNNALNTLNWFTTNPTPPGTTPALVQPGQQGNALGNLGASLVGSAFRSNSLWGAPTSRITPSPGINTAGLEG